MVVTTCESLRTTTRTTARRWRSTAAVVLSTSARFSMQGFWSWCVSASRRRRDRLIVESLKLIDQLIKVRTPVGDAWYRYNHDAYGETPAGGNYDGRNGVGRLWTLLTGERGEYETRGRRYRGARKRLDTLAGFANDGLMIPEQVWDREESRVRVFVLAAGTGSATPLAWSMAQFIRLAMSIERGRNVETPRVVWERYVTRGKDG